MFWMFSRVDSRKAAVQAQPDDFDARFQGQADHPARSVRAFGVAPGRLHGDLLRLSVARVHQIERRAVGFGLDLVQPRNRAQRLPVDAHQNVAALQAGALAVHALQNARHFDFRFLRPPRVSDALFFLERGVTVKCSRSPFRITHTSRARRALVTSFIAICFPGRIGDIVDLHHLVAGLRLPALAAAPSGAT